MGRHCQWQAWIPGNVFSICPGKEVSGAEGTVLYTQHDMIKYIDTFHWSDITLNRDLVIELDFITMLLTYSGRFPWDICNRCGMPTEDAYISGHLVLSHFKIEFVLMLISFFFLLFYVYGQCEWIICPFRTDLVQSFIYALIYTIIHSFVYHLFRL